MKDRLIIAELILHVMTEPVSKVIFVISGYTGDYKHIDIIKHKP
jgi:hypothetical protein